MKFIAAVLLACVAFRAQAAGEWFELSAGGGWWGSDLGHPVAKGLDKFAKRREELHCVAFTPAGDWVILFGGNGVWTSNVSLPAVKKLIELQKDHTLKCVAFAPNGGWTVFFDQNGSLSENVPEEAFKRIVEVGNAGGTFRSIAYGPKGEWVFSFDKAGVYFGSCPDELAKTLKDAVKNKRTVRCVGFTSRDAWFCLTNNGWWASDLAHPAAKSLAELSRAGESMKWVAVAPELGPHDYKKWAGVIHAAYDGHLAGGYGFEVRHAGKIVAGGAEGWARAPWEKQKPSVPWTLEKPMGIASVSKTITAVGLLKLWEETNHAFGLDDPFWPHIKAICPTANDDAKKITLRQLLTHRSGLKKGKDVTDPKALEKLLNEPLAHKPGTHPEYDNNNFYIARLALEQIGHVEYTAYVKEHVLKPMGITRMETHFEADAPTCGYTKEGERRPGFPFDWHCETTAGGAGWYGSVADLGMFLNGLREHKALNPTTTAEMYNDDLGWDSAHPAWEKNGAWIWDEGKRAGSLHSVIAHFPDDVDAVLLVNCDTPVDVVELVIRAWYESMGGG